MSWRSAAATLAGLLLAAAAVLWLFERQVSASWFRLGVQPEVIAALERSRDDQKRLARLEPEQSADYRRRFDEAQTLLEHLRILEHNRGAIVRRYELILLGLVGGILLTAGGAHLVRQGRRERRIARLRDALVRLSSGQDTVEVGDRGRDTLGRIAAMVEEVSRLMARDRRRLAAMENLSRWQETARRHAHEMRTPLGAAQLELSRLQELLAGDELPPAGEVRQVAGSVAEELDRLGRFTRQFTSFARLPQPRLEAHDLRRVIEETAETFARAWPNLTLRCEPPAEGDFTVPMDREMLRQALVNLCDNSALALGERRGTVTLRLSGTARDVILDVDDDGPGIPPGIRARVFEPYITTRPLGQGMGLGLAISKKILLDHGGDLELLETSEEETTFRLMLPRGPHPPGPPLPSAHPSTGRGGKSTGGDVLPASSLPSPGGPGGRMGEGPGVRGSRPAPPQMRKHPP